MRTAFPLGVVSVSGGAARRIGAAAGLHAAHERTASDGTPLGIIHRDVTPSNVLISFDGFRPDYLEIREANSLRPAAATDRQLVILTAAFLGSTRLIDNLTVDLE